MPGGYIGGGGIPIPTMAGRMPWCRPAAAACIPLKWGCIPWTTPGEVIAGGIMGGAPGGGGGRWSGCIGICCCIWCCNWNCCIGCWCIPMGGGGGAGRGIGATPAATLASSSLRRFSAWSDCSRQSSSGMPSIPTITPGKSALSGIAFSTRLISTLWTALQCRCSELQVCIRLWHTLHLKCRARWCSIRMPWTTVKRKNCIMNIVGAAALHQQMCDRRRSTSSKLRPTRVSRPEG